MTTAVLFSRPIPLELMLPLMLLSQPMENSATHGVAGSPDRDKGLACVCPCACACALDAAPATSAAAMTPTMLTRVCDRIEPPMLREGVICAPRPGPWRRPVAAPDRAAAGRRRST